MLNSKIFANNTSGASMTEVLLSMAIIAVATPFVYGQISRTNETLRDISVARQIMSVRDEALNFVRMNQDKWPDTAQIRLAADELSDISPYAVAGFIDKYSVTGATITDVYLAFETGGSELRANSVARHIGSDAAIVSNEGIAYGGSWAVAAPDFEPGDLIYRISRDVAGEDTAKYLHRATSGDDNLNVMERDLDMGHHHVYNVSILSGQSVRAKNGDTTFLDADSAAANTIYFSSGANVDGDEVSVGTMRVSGDVSGFRNIYADNLNGRGYTTTGRVITDRATIKNSVNVANDLILKSDSSKTVSGFTGITVNSVAVPYVSAEEMIFYDNFGLTVSGELLVSGTAALRFGNWAFPSTKPPQFNSFTVSRGKMPAMPSRTEFNSLYRKGWQLTQQNNKYTIR
ncbi:MAG: hypothetical protein IKW57_02275 [Alphaproteobacteria bacterium]|nr:hypothetical protein [Alphaproteobacteria bacterium]